MGYPSSPGGPRAGISDCLGLGYAWFSFASPVGNFRLFAGGVSSYHTGGFFSGFGQCLSGVSCADDQSIDQERTQADQRQDGQSGFALVPPKEGRLCSRLHVDSEKTQFCAPQSGSCAFNQRDGGDNLYSRRGPQPAGALHCAHSRRTRKRSSWSSLPRSPGHPRQRWR